MENYRHDCRTRFIDEYSTLHLDSPFVNASRDRKRKHDDDDMEDDEVYEQLFENLGASDGVGMDGNEYDTYVSAPRIAYKTTSLQYWKENERQFSHMARMARDVFAVPATGAGVERQFSRSGRIATALRCRLLPSTISAIMMYKDHLARTGHKGLVWEGAGLMAGEELIEDKESNAIPSEWQSGWWDRRKKQKTN